MGKTVAIIRKSIFHFLQNWQYFTSTPSLLAFPFAVAALLSQSLVSSSYLFPLIHGRLTALFLAAGFPPSSHLFAILSLNLSQIILTFFFVSPLTYSFLILAKASVIKAFHPNKDPTFSCISLFHPLFTTQLCNTLLVLAANSSCFFFLALAFNCLDVLGLSSRGALLLVSAVGAVLYSIILANANVISSLALVSSGMEKKGGFVAVLKACVLMQGRSLTALSLAVSVNGSLAAIEALFQYRIVRSFRAPNSALVFEGMLIAYLYALLIVLDSVCGCVFWRSCQKDPQIDRQDKHFHRIKIQEFCMLP